jgi:hypothetical protein
MWLSSARDGVRLYNKWPAAQDPWGRLRLARSRPRCGLRMVEWEHEIREIHCDQDGMSAIVRRKNPTGFWAGMASVRWFAPKERRSVKSSLAAR